MVMISRSTGRDRFEDFVCTCCGIPVRILERDEPSQRCPTCAPERDPCRHVAMNAALLQAWQAHLDRG